MRFISILNGVGGCNVFSSIVRYVKSLQRDFVTIENNWTDFIGTDEPADRVHCQFKFGTRADEYGADGLNDISPFKSLRHDLFFSQKQRYLVN